MEVFHHLADDSSTFIVGPSGGKVDLSHRIDNAACARFESIADIRYRAIRVNTHRIGEIRCFKFVFNVAFLYVFVHFCCSQGVR